MDTEISKLVILRDPSFSKKEIKTKVNCTLLTHELQEKGLYLSPQEIVDDISKKNSLNKMQKIAFHIIASKFFEVLTARLGGEHDTVDPLRLFLCGPGGTGKTHVVRCLQEVMRAFNSEHCIRFLAPTGTAASLLDGMTCHKGLGLKISSGKKSKRINTGDSLDYKWKDVEFLFIDEVSLISLQVLCEMDHALRL
ncbi:hypothetical protein SCHPADRAFT_831877, partial [Schizopora paradoxa]